MMPDCGDVGRAECDVTPEPARTVMDRPELVSPLGARRPRRILAIDGGGIRRLIGIEILLALKERLAARRGDPDARLCQHFDLVAGTSCGAIIASAIALGLPMREIRDFVLANARNMFRASSWYDRFWSRYDKTALEGNMKHWFGADTTVGS